MNSGHPTPRLNFIDVATGSLGQGLSVACGMAYVGKFIDKASYRTYCLMGDGESMEGNVWEAINFAGFYKLDNLCAIIDVNRLGIHISFHILQWCQLESLQVLFYEAKVPSSDSYSTI